MIALLEGEIPELVGKITGPTDAPPTELVVYIYYGPHNITWDGIEIFESTVAAVVLSAWSGGEYTANHDNVGRVAGLIYQAVVTAGITLPTADLILLNPITISRTSIGAITPAGTDTISSAVSFGVERKGGIDLHE